MKGSKVQTFWATWGVVMVILLGGSGFYLFKSHASYQEAQGGYELAASEMDSLASRPVYPTDDHLETMEDQVNAYDEKVRDLHEGLARFDKEFEKGISGPQFNNLLSDQVTSFRDDLPEGFQLPEEFQMGMEEYLVGSAAQPGATGFLKFQLEAIDHLLRVAVECDASAITSLTRVKNPLETGQPAVDQGGNPDGPLVERYPVQVSFVIPHGGYANPDVKDPTQLTGLMRFVNSISNDSEYFYVIRVLRIDNEQGIAPLKTADQGNRMIDPDTGLEVSGVGIDDNKDYIIQDARVIFGAQDLCVTAVIDVCRFPSRPENDAPANSDADA